MKQLFFEINSKLNKYLQNQLIKVKIFSKYKKEIIIIVKHERQHFSSLIKLFGYYILDSLLFSI